MIVKTTSSAMLCVDDSKIYSLYMLLKLSKDVVELLGQKANRYSVLKHVMESIDKGSVVRLDEDKYYFVDDIRVFNQVA